MSIFTDKYNYSWARQIGKLNAEMFFFQFINKLTMENLKWRAKHVSRNLQTLI